MKVHHKADYKRVAVALLVLFSLIAGLGFLSTVHAQTTLPRPSHVVVVMEENHSYSEIIGSSSALISTHWRARGLRSPIRMA